MCHYAECRHAKFHYAQCRCANCHGATYSMVKVCLKHNVWLKIPFLNQIFLMAITLVWRWLKVTNTPAYYGMDLITVVKKFLRQDESKNCIFFVWNKELKTLSTLKGGETVSMGGFRTGLECTVWQNTNLFFMLHMQTSWPVQCWPIDVLSSLSALKTLSMSTVGLDRHHYDTQHNSIQLNDAQHNDTQHAWKQHNEKQDNDI